MEKLDICDDLKWEDGRVCINIIRPSSTQAPSIEPVTNFDIILPERNKTGMTEENNIISKLIMRLIKELENEMEAKNTESSTSATERTTSQNGMEDNENVFLKITCTRMLKLNHLSKQLRNVNQSRTSTPKINLESTNNCKENEERNVKANTSVVNENKILCVSLSSLKKIIDHDKMSKGKSSDGTQFKIFQVESSGSSNKNNTIEPKSPDGIQSKVSPDESQCISDAPKIYVMEIEDDVEYSDDSFCEFPRTHTNDNNISDVTPDKVDALIQTDAIDSNIQIEYSESRVRTTNEKELSNLTSTDEGKVESQDLENTLLKSDSQVQYSDDSIVHVDNIGTSADNWLSVSKELEQDSDEELRREENRVLKMHRDLAELQVPRAFYTNKERENILKYIIDNNAYTKVKGNALWKQMEEDQVCKRTWHSMKEHFLKKISPRIHLFTCLNEKQKRKFVKSLAKKRKSLHHL